VPTALERGHNDGLTMTLSLCGDAIERNEANAYGAAVFFVSNDHTGTIVIRESVLRENVLYSGSPWEILPGVASARSRSTSRTIASVSSAQ
jgi:hypothetical protein